MGSRACAFQPLSGSGRKAGTVKLGCRRPRNASFRSEVALQGTAARAAGGRVLAARPPPPPSEVNAGFPTPGPPHRGALAPAGLAAGRLGEGPRPRPGKDGGGAGRDRAEAGRAACAAPPGASAKLELALGPQCGGAGPPGARGPARGDQPPPGHGRPGPNAPRASPNSFALATDTSLLFFFFFLSSLLIIIFK